MGFINSFKDEIKFLFSGKGMPYEKVCLMVAMITSVFLSVLLAGNFAKDAPVIVIDLDNSNTAQTADIKAAMNELIAITKGGSIYENLRRNLSGLLWASAALT